MGDETGGGRLIVIRDYVAAMRQRADALRGRVLRPAEPSRGAAAEEVLQELDTAQEELLVADEELRRQSEELERIRHGIAAELRRFRDLFDHAPDGYVETDARGVVRIANRTLAAQLNILPRFLEQKPLVSFVARGDCDRFRGLVGRLAEGRAVRAVSVRLRPRQGGTPFFVDLHAVPIVSPERQLLGARWTIRPMGGDDDTPASLASVRDVLKAIVVQAEAAAASKRVRVVTEAECEIPLEPERAASWFSILSAVLRAEVASGERDSELRVVAKAGAGATSVVEWQIGSAQVSLTATGSHSPG
jgi:PAS domain S-box-containing protein